MDVKILVRVEGLESQIQKARLAAKLSPTNLATALGMTASNLHLIESGKNKSIDVEILKKIDDTLGTSFARDVIVSIAENIS